ncbi:hypothetical protein Misp01_29960 [Microtetraspora sp. NBRC 13810]|uniref:hypothetical protein n=1 Tax=Microtetraspora sp. NBRC 13810 TaxID=3030990 RepID=UPI0024A580C8|nr:hypothetical protein [Microtetraspora sp. NBRC 13810]GLW07866.1 hypothetical protein Misp01_29960 [Microtetraspora sp. NBRC 13810]
MKFRTAFAVLLLTPVALSGQPAAAAASPTIAYAQHTKVWELVLTNGNVVKVPGALAEAPDDVVNAGARAPFLVSGDGRHFFYFRKSDGLFVERTVRGKERVVSRKITTATIDEEWPWVSNDGSYVVTTTSAPGVGVFADLRTGKVLPPPGRTDAWNFLGFSPNGKRLLLAGENLTVFDRGLRAQLRPKTRLSPMALANDYVTAAAPVGTWRKYRGLRLLNLRTGQAGAAVTVQLPRGQYVDDLDFDQAGRLIVRSRTGKGVAIYQVSKTTGKTTLLRTIARPDATAWVLPGDSSSEVWTDKKK